MTIQNERYRYIDYCKAVSIILVILGHINFANGGIVAWIYSFNMPAFFFISGLVIKKDENPTVKRSIRLIWKKTESLIFPYFIWALLYAELNSDNLLMILYGSQKMLSKSVSLTSLWFLTTLFLTFVFFEIAKLVFQKHFAPFVKLGLAAASFLMASQFPSISKGYPWNLDIAFSAFGFLLLGNLLFPMLNTIRGKLAGISQHRQIGICIGIVFISFGATLFYRSNLPVDGGVVVMAKGIYGNYLLFLPVALAGILFTVVFSIFLDLILPIMKRDILSFIGINTFCIFAVHKPIIHIVFSKVFNRFPLPTPIELIITCVGTLAISCLLSLFINHYLPLLAGKTPSWKKTLIPRSE